ncbi:adenosylcobinamide kinase/adenosylcobinamide phosphate guanyltransferase [Gemmatimonadetes bacterium T265]|nr:adenosylcobinamide kinase/adenosylcobinamide phosphate guanyltransferase [Gemmatimonadetes bacterium T265]
MPNASGAPGALPLTLLLGGVRSGKSARAVALAAALAGGRGRVLFAATAEAFDDDMARRIAAHRAERPAHWDTLEAPLDLPGALTRTLAAAPEPYAAVVVDCLTLWTSNLLLALPDPRNAEAVAAARAGELLAAAAAAAPAAAPAAGGPRWVVVSNEVGLGVVPPTPLGRAFRDALGRVNQRVAAAADEVTLMVAGLEVPVRRRAGGAAPA